MNRWIIIIFSLLLSRPGISQNDTINQTDANEIRQGYWIKNYDDGAKKAEGFFKDGKQIGVFNHYYPTGKIQTKIKHRTKSDTADALYYHTNGKIMGEGIYIDEKKEGLWLFYDDLEELSSAEVYKAGLKHGESKTFYLNQKLAKKVTYENGIETGGYIEYFRDGKIKEQGTFLEGSKHKEMKQFFPSGVVKTVGNYARGKRHGKWVYYNDKGGITAQEMYRYDKLQKQTLSEETEKEKSEFQKDLNKREGDYIPEDSIDE
ncbi:MAG: hypothetical protein JKY42_02285 [Flavobacteriales bacterium]|nr:hypothetical protein [Flavobacteriales bacterium]